MRQRFVTLIALLTLVSCRQPAPLSEAEKARIAADIRQTLNDYYSDIRRSGLTAEFTYLDTSSDFFWVPPGYAQAISYDSVRTILTQNAPGYRSVDNAFDTLEIIPLSTELATYTGRLRSTMTDTSNRTMTITLVETGVLIKRSSGWKLLSGQTSIVNP